MDLSNIKAAHLIDGDDAIYDRAVPLERDEGRTNFITASV